MLSELLEQKKLQEELDAGAFNFIEYSEIKAFVERLLCYFYPNKSSIY